MNTGKRTLHHERKNHKESTPRHEVRHVLLIVQKQGDAELMSTALSEPSHAVQLVRVLDGRKALDYLHRREQFRDRPRYAPDLVLLDLELRGISGLQVLQQIKTTNELTAVPVVVISSHAEPSVVRECYECGANGYVSRPANAQEFASKVKQIATFWLEVNLPPQSSDVPQRDPIWVDFVREPLIKAA